MEVKAIMKTFKTILRKQENERFTYFVLPFDASKVFDIKKAWKVLSKDWMKTLMALLYQIVVMILFMLLSIPIITLIVTIPAMKFTGSYFLVDLYNKQA